MGVPKIEPANATIAVTGGGRGIGRATAQLFAARGATVCIGDLDPDAAAEAAEEIGPKALPFALDVASRTSFAEFIAASEELAGPLDVLVNNAGVMPAGNFVAEDDATTSTILDVNLRGPLNGMRLVLPRMISRRRGHVVNVASLLGKTELPGLATYTASKHAVVGLSAAVRAELAGTGVTVTTVLPGIVNTELASGIAIPFASLARVEPQDVARAIVESCAGRQREIVVPSWMSLYPALRPFVPDVVEAVIRRLLGDDRALRAVNEDERAPYLERLAQQTSERD